MKNLKFLSVALLAIIMLMIQPPTTSGMAPGAPMNLAVIDDDVAVANDVIAGTVLTPETMVIDQAGDIADTGDTEVSGLINMLKGNWVEILFALLAVVEIVVRITPSNSDNSVLSWIMKILNLLIPNKKTGGGVIIPLTRSQLK